MLHLSFKAWNEVVYLFVISQTNPFVPKNLHNCKVLRFGFCEKYFADFQGNIIDCTSHKVPQAGHT